MYSKILVEKILLIFLLIQNSCRENFPSSPSIPKFLSREYFVCSIKSKILVEKAFCVFQISCREKVPCIPIFSNSCLGNLFYIPYLPKFLWSRFSLYCLYSKILVERIFRIFVIFLNSSREDSPNIPYNTELLSRKFYLSSLYSKSLV